MNAVSSSLSSPSAGPAFRLVSFLAFVAGGALYVATAQAAVTPVDLGTAAGFAVLAGAGITITGPTIVTGDLGTAPTPAITGLGNLTLHGVNHANDAVTTQAKVDLATAYVDAAGRAAGTSFTGGLDLVGLTLASGVYHDESSLFLSGTLTLDAQGDADAVWIFQAGSTLITAADSRVVLLGGAQACHVFWQVGSSATLGTGTDFAGNILALTSVTLSTGALVDGRVFARNGAVTFDANSVTLAVCKNGQGPGGGGTPVPETGSVLFLTGSGLAILLAFRRRFLVGAWVH